METSAGKEFLNDCGNMQVARVAAAILKETGVVQIDNCIEWTRSEKCYGRLNDGIASLYKKNGEHVLTFFIHNNEVIFI